jgi:ABC-type nickel/cobalt efflux system permease component RcnA
MKTPRWLLPVLFASLAAAHPMGNLSVNHYAKLTPGAKGVDVVYVLDLAELPTFELLQTWGVAKDAPKDVLEAKAAQQAREWVGGLSFTEGGHALTAKLLGTELSWIDGAGNLPVFRILTRLHVAASGGRFEYADNNYPTRAGWREVVIAPGVGADVAKASNGSVDISEALTSYPQDPTKAPPQDSRGWFEWKPLAAPVSEVRKPVIVAPQPGPVVAAAAPVPEAAAPMPETPRDARPAEAPSMGTVKRGDTISRLLRSKTISIGLMVTLIGLSFWFGALHALEPGHGKTMVAAYLVGERGTPMHAVILGSMVTFTHTISVFILGVATMFLSRYVMPDRISKVLGILSGLSIVWIGGMLLWRRARKLAKPMPHEHSHNHPHTHGPHTHSHDEQKPHSHLPEGDISVTSLMALGASGGLVPCPSALILLLSAISIGRPGLGVILLLSFSLGLAIVLTVTGLFVLYAKNLLPEGTTTNNAFFRYMPVISAAAIMLVGVVMTSVSLGWIPAGRFIG